MPIAIRAGDLFGDPSVTVLAHGCNCAGVMGRGIAKQFKKRWPQMFVEYRGRCLNEKFRLGDVFVWREAGYVIFNLGTQATWKTRADLGAIEKSLRRAAIEAEAIGIPRISMPRIGSGLGGLPWSDVKSVIERVAASTAVLLEVFEMPED